MDKDTALKLALEALQWHWGGEPLPTLELQAINAIKEALAQSDDLTIAYMAGFHAGKNTPHPKPKQEPVAWNVVDPTGKIVATEMNSVRGWARIEGYKPTVEGLLGFHEQGWRVVPTTPPQREWVGLTEEEYKNIRYGSDESGPYVSYGSYDEGYECGSEIEIYVDDFAKAIEAKLREKNGG